MAVTLLDKKHLVWPLSKWCDVSDGCVTQYVLTRSAQSDIKETFTYRMSLASKYIF